MSDIFKETNEALRQEQMIRKLRRYVPLFVLIFVALISGVVVYQYLSYSHAETVDKEASAFIALHPELRSSKDLSDTDIQAAEQLMQGSTGFALVTHFEIARYHLARDENDAAYAIYERVMSNDDWDAPYQSFAELQLIILDYQNDKDYARIKERIQAFVSSPDTSGTPWYAQALMWGAQAALGSNQKDEAEIWLEQLTNFPATPDQLRHDSSIVLQQITSETVLP